MNAYVAVTDGDWFTYLRELSEREKVDEVNFWTPKPWGGRFRVLERGQPLLFKLKSPRNAIAGGGFFEHYTELPISLAWESFGRKNGALTLDDVRRRIARLRRDAPRPWEDYTIGCILLVEPFFWPEELWIPQPEDWSPNIVRGRTYDLQDRVGERLWGRVAERLAAYGSEGLPRADRPDVPGRELEGGYTDTVLGRRRVGQGTFSAVIRDLYGRQCAVTREKALPVLDAAHIRPYSETPEHYVNNGLLLRSDVHRLFDAGYVTVTPELQLEVSHRIRSDFDDGENYEKLHGRSVWVPERRENRPHPENLRWHNENRFRG